VTDFSDADLTGSRFHNVDLTDARFELVDLTGSTMRSVALVNATLRDAYMENLVIWGEIEGLQVNGVDVGPLVEAELDRRYPDRVLMRPRDADGFRVSWDALERLWSETVERCRAVPPAVLHEQPDGEWSVIENLRHLVFATDAWVCRALLGNPAPWDPLDLPHDEMPDSPGVPRHRVAHPSLDEVLALRADRMATVRQVLADLTDEQLAGVTEPVMEPGYPESESFAVARCLRAVVNEEWQHRLYIERDLDRLVALSG
jgi:uncharacterized protein YjbI with pentapeptide repeats